jgi:hypothetical protein
MLVLMQIILYCTLLFNINELLFRLVTLKLNNKNIIKYKS